MNKENGKNGKGNKVPKKKKEFDFAPLMISVLVLGMMIVGFGIYHNQQTLNKSVQLCEGEGLKFQSRATIRVGDTIVTCIKTAEDGRVARIPYNLNTYNAAQSKFKEGDIIVFIKDYRPFNQGDIRKIYSKQVGEDTILAVKQSNGDDRNIQDRGFEASVKKVISCKLTFNKKVLIVQVHVQD